MFGTEALRLLREEWTDLNEFAQEVYVLLSSPEIPLEHSGPVTLTKRPGSTDPALTFKGYDPGNNTLSIEREDGVPLTIGPSGFGMGDEGFLPADPESGHSRDQRPEDPYSGAGGSQPPEPQNQGNVFVGTVQTGSGLVYDVLLLNGDLISATQLLLATGETIPAGTPVFVVQDSSDMNYYINVPVWLDDLP